MSPNPVPAANVNGVTVGGGWVEATDRQVVRTAGNQVYVVVSDDNACNATRSPGSGVIHVYKGSGAQAANPNVPTAFSEVDASHHPTSAGRGSCIFTGGTSNLLFAPDIRLDNNGIIHAAYIDPNATNNGKLYYQTFDTNTDLWGTRVQVAPGAQTNVGGGWPRGSHAVLVLDSNGIPYIAFASGGTSNSVRWVARTASGGTAWLGAATIPGSTGTDQFQPSMVTALDGTIHLTWCNNCLAAHPTIRYAKFSSGAWGPVETVSSGDTNVLGDADHDQIPAVATDLSSRPHVLYLDGTANGPDNYVRMRYRTSDGTWTDNTPPGTAGPSNPNGTWYCHTPQNYISSNNDIYVFLGHDRNISPGPYQYQFGGVGNNWSAVNQLDPRNQTNTTAGDPGLDGSASIRFDPLRDNNPSIIDVIYYDESDGTPGYAHHATVYYKALDMYSLNPTTLSVTPTNLSFSANQGGSNPASSSVNVTNTGTGTLSFTAVSDSPWLTASPAGGNTPQALTVAVDTSGLAPGSYTGHITVTSSAAQNLPLTIAVTLTVTAAPTLSSITLNPTSVVAGNSSTGTVTLSGPAPSGGTGIAVSLTSDNAAGQVPGSVTVAANATSANFTVNTSSVTTATTVTISGSYNSTTKSAPLTVTPPVPVTLSSLTLNPVSLVGGNTATGTVTLSGPASASGSNVQLTSDNGAVTVPGSVVVAANATSANFTVTTGSVTTAATVTISGTLNSTTQSATLMVTPSVPVTLSSVTVNPTSLVGGNPATGTVTLSGVAPTGGIMVSLSSDSAAGQVPVNVTVAANTTSTSFTVATSSVAAATTVTISGTYNSTTKSATFTIVPVPVTLSSVTMNPTSLVGGNSATGTVTLSGPAPGAGVVVTLASNNSAAQVQANVTVAANATNANFTVTTSSVTTAATVTISGTYNTTTKSATLTVVPVPVALSSVTVNPASLVGGNSATGAVTLSGPAPAGGVTVSLTSNNSAAQVQASVTVAASATSANFTVTTSSVTTATTVTISGTYISTTQSANLTLTPVPLPPALVLSSVGMNPITVVGGNNSVGTVTLSGVAPAGGATVTLSSNSTSAQVAASVLVSAGATTATFTVTTAVISTSTLVTITGQYGGSQIATLTVTPATRPVLFGDQAIETNLDSDSRGMAEAFQTTATASGTLSSLTVYLDSTSTATKVYMGLYADNSGHPGALLSQGTSTQLAKGSWNVISTAGIPITSGTKYWIAILGTTSGTPFFRDRHNGACKSETSQQTTLAALPATWITGTVYADCPISAYGQ